MPHPRMLLQVGHQNKKGENMFISKQKYEYFLKCEKRAKSVWEAQARYRKKKKETK